MLNENAGGVESFFSEVAPSVKGLLGAAGVLELDCVDRGALAVWLEG